MQEKSSVSEIDLTPLNIQDETSTLKKVIVGIAENTGEPLDINPMSRWHIQQGTYPTDDLLKVEVEKFERLLVANGVEVLRPQNIDGVEQIFCRDIGFVIEDYFLIANMKAEVRKKELPGIQHIIETFDPEKVIHIPKEAIIEGGDVVLWNEYIFVGQSDRTNYAGYKFIKETFPNKLVYPVQLNFGDDPEDNVLHLDCAFQPIGENLAIIYEDGFTTWPNIIFELFGADNFIRVSKSQKNRMFPNILSLSKNTVIVEKSFNELKFALKSKGFNVLEVDFYECSKLSGLFRCATLPLERVSS
ncbi:MAG: amidinotransferase [Cytophagales bacterium CG12_big_fil_rev_8_21_14_0_65_40_12]|nr:MAG: amidinotransferase [Cytophagales bacterium CG12_big_fil_rev_8_21_14_0_65_40_12]PIW05227.1 MAG: amidinotransferase [Cytophagales bacterium CG17_big_fil_post_rev_8_21_14_2_50_40_13]